MNEKLDNERAGRAAEMAAKIMSDLVMDGEDELVIYTIFSIGSAICAQIHDLDKEKYLKGCGKFYEETTRFLKDIGLGEE